MEEYITLQDRMENLQGESMELITHLRQQRFLLLQTEFLTLVSEQAQVLGQML